MSALDDLRKTVAQIEATKRYVIVHPDHEEGARKVVAESPYPGLYEVKVSAECPLDRAFILPTTFPYIRDEGTSHD